MFATSTLELTIRMLVAMAVLLAILLLATKFARRHLNGRGQDRPNIDVKFQRQLTKHATLSLVTAGTRHLLIATNNQAITLLAEGDDLVAAPAVSADPAADRTSAQAMLSGPTIGPIDPPAADSTARTAGSIDIRKSAAAALKANPLKTLQNRTVRRA